MFLMHRYLALPVVDDAQRIVGIVDAGLLTEEVFDLTEQANANALFEAIGFHVAQVRDASVLGAFRYRFPWLLATVTSGILCAWLTSVFEITLAKSIVLAFFLTLLLGLGESVSIQSMTVTIQTLRVIRPTWRWYLRALRREAGTAVLLGVSCGGLVGLLVWFWRGAAWVALTIGGSILLALCAACFFGLGVPALLHTLKLDPKIAAGPITLAITDIFTLLFYFGMAALIL
jgi:magnesium transporter